MFKDYWTVKIYYGGDAPIQECFHTKEEAQAFYDANDKCDPPRMFYADTQKKIQWAEDRIATRESIAD